MNANISNQYILQGLRVLVKRDIAKIKKIDIGITIAATS